MRDISDELTLFVAGHSDSDWRSIGDQRRADQGAYKRSSRCVFFVTFDPRSYLDADIKH